MKFPLIAVFLVLALAGSIQAETVFFDASLDTSPTAQGMYYVNAATFDLTGPSVTPGQPLELQTDTATQAGYFNHDDAVLVVITFPVKSGYEVTLDRQAGYTVEFAMRVIQEEHTNPTRAGMSLLVLGDDHQGIELGFHEDEIFTQAVDFTAGSAAVVDTTAAMIDYQLAVSGGTFSLWADGGLLLSGPLVDYTTNPTVQAAGNTMTNGYHVYNQTGFLFFGDNTTSAGGSFSVERLAVLPYAVPEPATWLLMFVGLVGLYGYRRRWRAEA